MTFNSYYSVRLFKFSNSFAIFSTFIGVLIAIVEEPLIGEVSSIYIWSQE